MADSRIFLLSPASCAGGRARLVFREKSGFPLARQLRSPQGAPLGEVFRFLSGLYFRGKLAYASAFARPPSDLPGVLVITANRGLWKADDPVTLGDLRAFARVPIAAGEPRYRRPLARDARRIAEAAGDGCDFVLLGSVATGKYLDVLVRALGTRLLFPADFVGRGDMSRGGLMLRRAAEGRELTYVPVDGTARRGPRPPKLGRGA